MKQTTPDSQAFWRPGWRCDGVAFFVMTLRDIIRIRPDHEPRRLGMQFLLRSSSLLSVLCCRLARPHSFLRMYRQDLKASNKDLKVEHDAGERGFSA